MLAAALAAAGLAALAAPGAVFARDGTNARAINGRVVAVGIPGAPAVSPVGAFLPGSPINSNSELAALTQPGRVMDPTRIVVGSRSNFGAPKANADQAAGSFLSIDPRAAQLAVPRSSPARETRPRCLAEPFRCTARRARRGSTASMRRWP